MFSRLITVKLLIASGLALVAMHSQSAVLPDERADIMLHSYDGGGLEVSGPAVLVRKNIGNSVSVNYGFYEDNITSASIDVQVSGSAYEEHREEHSLGLEYLNGKTKMSFSFTNSEENDYLANTVSFGISQDFFGDLTTLDIGYGYGRDDISERTANLPVRVFTDRSDIERHNYRIGMSQILTKNSTVGFAFETIADEGTAAIGSTTTLNNPYRQYSYYSPSDPTRRLFADELYPRTHTSNALAIRGSYFLEAFKSGFHWDYRIYQDSWGVSSNTYTFKYSHPFGPFLVDFRYRFYDQNQADFYRDIFDYENQFTFMARDKELSTYTATGVGATMTYEFAKNGWGFIDKGSVNVALDIIDFEYENFRDATENFGATPVDAGLESLYEFKAKVFHTYLSIWY